MHASVLHRLQAAVQADVLLIRCNMRRTGVRPADLLKLR
jgi:hypothetical protein